jgi:hypothetical protein
VQADSLSQAAAELYGLLPAEFTAARDERARQAKAAGEGEAAAQIRKLARPTVSAWLVNQLVRADPAEMDRLFQIGQSLEDAQRELAGDRMRELSGQRRQAISDLLAHAGPLAAQAGLAASTSVLDEVRATLEAAVADGQARAAVRAGHLSRPLSYAGLGEVDLAAALAASQGRPERHRPERRESAPGGAAPSQAEQARALRAAEKAAAAAAKTLAVAESKLTSLSEQRQFLQRRLAHLRRELAETESEDASLEQAVAEATRSRDAAADDASRAERDLTQVRERQAP